MTRREWTVLKVLGKPLREIVLGAAVLTVLAACSVNPATGQQQFTALMSPGQERVAGAQEHAKVMKTFGAPAANDSLQAYVESVGRKVAAVTERQDVTYRFFLLDTPMLNAFALPGGYVYVTRGILSQANDESELAAVLAHEIGHITARHAAERYSHGVLTSLGAAVIAAAADSPQVANVAGLGSDLYIKSYSRQQESQADELGIRYLHHAGYDPMGMERFLSALGAADDAESHRQGNVLDGYFSTHPRTGDRVIQARTLAQSYSPAAQPAQNREAFLKEIEGMVYGDSARQGFVRGQNFWHPQMGLTFSVPDGFIYDNQPTQVVATDQRSGAVILFDAAPNHDQQDPATYVAQTWLKGKAPHPVEQITVNGMAAAATSLSGTVKNKPVTIQVMAIAWTANRFFRFQLAIPAGAEADLVDDLKRTTYSLRPMTAQEKEAIQPLRVRVITVAPGDTIESLAARMAVEGDKKKTISILNSWSTSSQPVPGQKIKIISDR